MTIKPAILNVALLISVFSMTTSGFAADKARQALLRDGFALRGVNGQVKNAEGGEKWLFELDSDLSDEENVVKAGTSLRLLPSTTLENITADLKERSANNYMLWGIVTKYKGKNFIFPLYFLATIKAIEPEKPVKVRPKQQPQEQKAPEQPQESQDKSSEPNNAPPAQQSQSKPDVSDANGILEMPKEILEMLDTGKVERPAKLRPAPKPKKPTVPDSKPVEESKTKPEPEPKPKPEPKREPKPEPEPEPKREPEPEPEPAKGAKLKLDPILADRTAFLVKQKNGRFVFALDALGRNVQEISLRLLPCEALELTELRQSAATEPLLFKIAGIRTKYKGKHYLLLQKATRVYSHGNFRAPIL